MGNKLDRLDNLKSRPVTRKRLTRESALNWPIDEDQDDSWRKYRLIIMVAVFFCVCVVDEVNQ